MESQVTQYSDRMKYIQTFLTTVCGLSHALLSKMAGDASLRQYFRVYHQDKTLALMDALMQPESCRPFISISKTLKRMGINTPDIFAADEKGLLLLTDFGDLTYLRALKQQPHLADILYRNSLLVLARLQQCRESEGLSIPFFTDVWMKNEWIWHKDWFLNQWLNIVLSKQDEAKLDQCMMHVITSITQQPYVFMHRDYHSANLMVLRDQQVGVLDFQDAFMGPITYDLASLLRDCYIDWPQENILAWLYFYYEQLQPIHFSKQEFLFWFDYMSIERHLKALFTFTRKAIRDGQMHYLHHIPRTLQYLSTVSSFYPELKVLHHYLEQVTQAAVERINTPCVQ